ncbi:class I adenylate-forming enzyme family protein [Chloroflexota bacterium]
MVIGEILLRNATNNPDNLAVVCKSTDTSRTYGELNTIVNRFTHALTDIGVSKGDRVAIVQHNCLQYIETIFAVMKIGAVVVPLDYRLVARELTYLLNDSGANTLLIGANYLNLANSIRSQLSTVKNFLCIGQGAEDMQSYDELLSSYPSTEPDTYVDENDLAMLLYTSGTTGLPKAATTTQRNLVASMMNMMEPLSWQPDDVTLHTSPFSHVAATWPLLDNLYIGGTNVVVERFDPKVVLEAIQENRVTSWNSIPTMISRLLEYPDLTNYDLSSLRWVVYGGAPMPIEVLRRAILNFGNIFAQVYGLTEAHIVTFLPIEDHITEGAKDKVRKISSCGKAVGCNQVRVVNGQGKDVLPDETGEIIMRGDNVIRGYWKLPEETASTIKGGWFYTGDLATLDEEGYIYIIDRKKELIVSGGENISPKEVEGVIYGHPSVFEVAVIGVPDEKWGEAVKAIVVLRVGKTATEEEIIAFCKQNLARFKVPKSITFTDSLPKTASGKIFKGGLKSKQN